MQNRSTAPSSITPSPSLGGLEKFGRNGRSTWCPLLGSSLQSLLGGRERIFSGVVKFSQVRASTRVFWRGSDCYPTIVRLTCLTLSRSTSTRSQNDIRFG